MADAKPSGSEPRIPPNGFNVFSIPEGRDLRAIYQKLTPEQRTWRCEQTHVSTELLEKSWELLRPIVEGRWDKEKCYNGLALFVKGMYESQGHASLPTTMVPRMGELMRIIQDRVPWVTVGGKRQQADDNPARYALRVAFNCVVMLLISGLTMGTEAGQQPKVQADNAEMQGKALMMSAGCVDKLGGPGLHEGTLSGQDAQIIARLATAGTSEEAQRMCTSAPISLIALYMLQVLYDIDLRKVKWVLLYVAVRCAKEVYTRARAAVDSAATATARSAWLSHSANLASIDPDSPLAAFMVAEAKSSSGANPDTLAAMRKATKVAERRGDDLLSWLAHLNVALLLVHGGEGGRGFSEDAVLNELDAAAAQRSSVSKWGGTILLDNRCRALKESILKQLDEARELARKMREDGDAEAGAGATEGAAAGGQPPLPEGLLPYTASSKLWDVTPLVPLEPRECGGCHKLFHKAQQCGRCRQFWYCSRECQAAHWRAGHKKECAKLAAAKKEDKEAAEPADGE